MDHDGEGAVELTTVGHHESSAKCRDHSLPAGENANDEREHDALLQRSIGSSRPLRMIDEQRRCSPSVLSRARSLLYLSHLFAQFSEISWQFCMVLFLSALTNYQSLLLVSTYGLTTGLAVTLWASTAGAFLDQTPRLVAARIFLVVENTCVVVATILCYLLLSSKASTTGSKTTVVPTDATSIVLLVGIHALGALARVLDEGFLVAMERDWVVVMSKAVADGTPFEAHGNEKVVAPIDDDDEEEDSSRPSKVWLNQTNVTMKQIDLSCKVIAPAVSGFLLALIDGTDAARAANLQEISVNNGSQLKYAALAVGAVNAMALVVEYICTALVYYSIPELAAARQSSVHEDHHHNNKSNGEISEQQKESEDGLWRSTANEQRPCGIQAYFRQSIAFAGLSLAMLYLNALTFDAIMTSYLVWRGMRLETIGVWRGISSAIGLLGTCVYHFSANHMSLAKTGLWSIVYEFLCLSISYASLYVQDNRTSLGMLIAGVCASRIGLWVFDIAVTTMTQNQVPDGVRGVVGGVQQSLNAFFNLLSYALGIVFPDPRYFHIYVTAGYTTVGIAMVLYCAGLNYQKRLSANS